MLAQTVQLEFLGLYELSVSLLLATAWGIFFFFLTILSHGDIYTGTFYSHQYTGTFL